MVRARLLSHYEYIRSSYWFIPSVLAVFAALLAAALIELDRHFGPNFATGLPFVMTTQPDGARAVLSAIGGSMIGVAGTVFSVTMAAAVYASGNYGPRILNNFMNDRGNQFTLGTFTATFLYSILVLRTVRTASAEDAALLVEPFVPVLATFGATLLAVASIGVLIYFIHHVPSNIYVVNVIDGVGRSILAGLDQRYPDMIGDGPEEAATDAREAFSQVPTAFRSAMQGGHSPSAVGEVEARRPGYIQIFDEDALLAIAEEKDLVLRVNCRPGFFTTPGAVLFDVWPPEKADDEVRQRLSDSIVIAPRRSSQQDLLFLIDELGEIAARALSPGVNDPYTAVNAMEWMTVVLCEVARRRMPSPLRLDENGRLRVIAPPASFEQYLDHAFGNFRQYAAKDMITARQFLIGLGRIARNCREPSQVEALRDMGDELLALSEAALGGASIETVRKAHAVLQDTLSHPSRRERPDELPLMKELVPTA